MPDPVSSVVQPKCTTSESVIQVSVLLDIGLWHSPTHQPTLAQLLSKHDEGEIAQVMQEATCRALLKCVGIVTPSWQMIVALMNATSVRVSLPTSTPTETTPPEELKTSPLRLTPLQGRIVPESDPE